MLIVNPSQVKPLLWAVDPGIISYNASRIGLPIPIALLVWSGGDIWPDLSSRGNNGILGGSAAFVANYVDFPGANDSVSISIDLSPYDQITIFSTFQADAWTDTDILWEYSANFNDETDAFVCLRSAGGPILGTAKGADYVQWGTTTSPAANTEYNLAVTYDRPANAIRGYLNGILDGSETLSSMLNGNFGNHTLFIGARAGTQLELDGRMKCFYIFGQVFNSSQAAILSANPYGLVQPPERVWAVEDVVVGLSIMNQLQGSNMGADLYNGTLL